MESDNEQVSNSSDNLEEASSITSWIEGEKEKDVGLEAIKNDEHLIQMQNTLEQMVYLKEFVEQQKTEGSRSSADADLIPNLHPQGCDHQEYYVDSEDDNIAYFDSGIDQELLKENAMLNIKQ